MLIVYKNHLIMLIYISALDHTKIRSKYISISHTITYFYMNHRFLYIIFSKTDLSSNLIIKHNPSIAKVGEYWLCNPTRYHIRVYVCMVNISKRF